MTQQNWNGEEYRFYIHKGGMVALSIGAIGVGVLVFLWMAIKVTTSNLGGIGMMAFSWALLGFFSWLLFLISKPVFSRDPVLHVNPKGIRSSLWRNVLIPWSDIVDIRKENVQGHWHLIFELQKNAVSIQATKNLLFGSGVKRQISLSTLKAKDSERALAWTLQAWAAHGGVVAQQRVSQSEHADAELKAFTEKLEADMPVPWALYILMSLSVIVWLGNIIQGLSPIKPSAAQLLTWGGNSAASVILDQEYWRLLTATFLHSGVVHLAFNMLGLWGAGLLLNRLHGHWQFLLIYLGSALVGSALSLHYAAQTSVSVGASGAVFGVLGAAFTSVLQNKSRLPSLMTKNTLSGQAIFIAYALIYGFSQKGIDHAAHIGGLLCGAVLSWVLIEKIDSSKSAKRRMATQILSVALITSAVIWLVKSTPLPTVHHRQLFAFQKNLESAKALFATTQKAIQDDAKASQSSAMSDDQFRERMKNVHIPALKALDDQLAKTPLPANDVNFPIADDLRRSFDLIRLLMETELARNQTTSETERAELSQKISAYQSQLKIVNARIEERNKSKSKASR